MLNGTAWNRTAFNIETILILNWVFFNGTVLTLNWIV